MLTTFLTFFFGLAAFLTFLTPSASTVAAALFLTGFASPSTGARFSAASTCLRISNRLGDFPLRLAMRSSMPLAVFVRSDGTARYSGWRSNGKLPLENLPLTRLQPPKGGNIKKPLSKPPPPRPRGEAPAGGGGGP